MTRIPPISCFIACLLPPPRCPQNALHERKWLASLGLSVVFYLNPIKVVGNFASPESASWGLASEMCFSVAVVMFLVVGLRIAGGVGRDWVGGGLLGFYVPKVKGARAYACTPAYIVDSKNIPYILRAKAARCACFLLLWQLDETCCRLCCPTNHQIIASRDVAETVSHLYSVGKRQVSYLVTVRSFSTTVVPHTPCCVPPGWDQHKERMR